MPPLAVFLYIYKCKTNAPIKNMQRRKKTMANNFYDVEMYDLDPNYDESNVDLDSYEREADYYEAERAEGVTVKNYADTNDPVCERLHNWNDCFWFRKYFGM